MILCLLKEVDVPFLHHQISFVILDLARYIVSLFAVLELGRAHTDLNSMRGLQKLDKFPACTIHM